MPENIQENQETQPPKIDKAKNFWECLEKLEKKCNINDTNLMASREIFSLNFKIDALQQQSNDPKLQEMYQKILQKHEKILYLPIKSAIDFTQITQELLSDLANLRTKDGRVLKDVSIDAWLIEWTAAIFNWAKKWVEKIYENLKQSIWTILSPSEWLEIAHSIAKQASNPIDLFNNIMNWIKQYAWNLLRDIQVRQKSTTTAWFSAEMWKFIPEIWIPALFDLLWPWKFLSMLKLDKLAWVITQKAIQIKEKVGDKISASNNWTKLSEALKSWKVKVWEIVDKAQAKITTIKEWLEKRWISRDNLPQEAKDFIDWALKDVTDMKDTIKAVLDDTWVPDAVKKTLLWPYNELSEIKTNLTDAKWLTTLWRLKETSNRNLQSKAEKNLEARDERHKELLEAFNICDDLENKEKELKIDNTLSNSLLSLTFKIRALDSQKEEKVHKEFMNLVSEAKKWLKDVKTPSDYESLSKSINQKITNLKTWDGKWLFDNKIDAWKADIWANALKYSKQVFDKLKEKLEWVNKIDALSKTISNFAEITELAWKISLNPQWFLENLTKNLRSHCKPIDQDLSVLEANSTKNGYFSEASAYIANFWIEKLFKILWPKDAINVIKNSVN